MPTYDVECANTGKVIAIIILEDIHYRLMTKLWISIVISGITILLAIFVNCVQYLYYSYQTYKDSNDKGNSATWQCVYNSRTKE